MKRLLPLQCLCLLPSCTCVQEAPPVHRHADTMHYEVLKEEKAASLRRALADYATIDVEKVWFSSLGEDPVVRRRTLRRSAPLDARLAVFAAAPRWYSEHWNTNSVVFISWAYTIEATFRDASGRELCTLSSCNSVFCRGEDGQGIDFFESLEPFMPVLSPLNARPRE